MVQETIRDWNWTIKHSVWSTLIIVGYFFRRKNKQYKNREGQLLVSKGVRPDANVEKTKYRVTKSSFAAAPLPLRKYVIRKLHPPEIYSSFYPLEFDLSELKVRYRSSSLQLQCGPIVFWKYFSTHNGRLVLKCWQILFEYYIAILSRNVNCPKFYLVLLILEW